jgi:hypothetical protein
VTISIAKKSQSSQHYIITHKKDKCAAVWLLCTPQYLMIQLICKWYRNKSSPDWIKNFIIVVYLIASCKKFFVLHSSENLVKDFHVNCIECGRCEQDKYFGYGGPSLAFSNAKSDKAKQNFPRRLNWVVGWVFVPNNLIKSAKNLT